MPERLSSKTRKYLSKQKALKIAGYTPIMGRPSVGTKRLPAIALSESLYETIRAKAVLLDVSLPEARRMAYRAFVSK